MIRYLSSSKIFSKNVNNRIIESIHFVFVTDSDRYHFRNRRYIANDNTSTFDSREFSARRMQFTLVGTRATSNLSLLTVSTGVIAMCLTRCALT